MPQGTILAVRPFPLDDEYEWIEGLRKFISKNNQQEVKIGVIETCETEAGVSDIKTGDKLLFIIPEVDLPDEIFEGSCEDTNATKVTFKIEKKPFIYAYDVHKVK